MPSRPPPSKPAATTPSRRFSSPLAELTAGLRGDGAQGGMWARAGELLRRTVLGQAAGGRGAQTAAPAPSTSAKGQGAATAQPPTSTPAAESTVNTQPPRRRRNGPAEQRKRLAAIAAAQAAANPAQKGRAGVRIRPPPTKAATPAAPPPEKQPSIARLRQHLMAGIVRLDSVFNAFTGMGEYGDKGSQTQVDMQWTPMSPDECAQLWRSNAYAARACEELPLDVCRKGWSIASNDVSAADQAKLGEQAAIKLGLVQKVCEAMTWARVVGQGAILIVCDEVVPLNKRASYLSEPLGTYPIRRIRQIQVFERRELTVYEWEGDVGSKRYREGKSYLINPKVPNDTIRAGAAYHASRFMLFSGRKLPAGMKLENSGFDDSVLQMAMDAIFGATAVDKVGATLAQMLNVTVLSSAMLDNVDQPDMLAVLRERGQMIAEQISNNNLLVLQPGENMENRGVSINGYDQLAERSALALCAATKMPAVRLFGEAPAGLSTDGASQQKLWDGQIVGAQELIRGALHQFYNALFFSQQGPTGGKPVKYTISFPSPTTLTSTEEAQLRKAVAEVDAIYLGLGVYTPRDVRATRGQANGHLKDVVVQTEALGADDKLRQADLAAKAEEDRLRGEEALAAQGQPPPRPPAAPPTVPALMPAAPPTSAAPFQVEPRLDAELNSAVIWIEFPEEAAQAHGRLVRAIEQAVPSLTIVPETTPHLTLIYLGVLANPKADIATIAAVMDAIGAKWPVTKIITDDVMTFPPQDEQAPSPVTLAIREGDWHLRQLNGVLTRRLAHVIQAEQFDEYQPHATLGYAQLSQDLRERMMQFKAAPIEFAATRMRLVINSEVVHETTFPGHGWPGSLVAI